MRPPGPWAEAPGPTSTRNGPGTTAPPTTSGSAEPTPTAKPLQPAAADGEFAPPGPPAPDHESRTGGAGGNTKAEGGAEAGQRVQGLLLGLAAGDAAGWPAARHRAARMPDWTRRLTRELDTFAEQNATTTLPVPIALNQPPNPSASAPPTTPNGRPSPQKPSSRQATAPPSAT